MRPNGGHRRPRHQYSAAGVADPSQVSREPNRRQPGSESAGAHHDRTTLAQFRGNRKEAAEALKISTVTLWRKMKQYGLVSAPK